MNGEIDADRARKLFPNDPEMQKCAMGLAEGAGWPAPEPRPASRIEFPHEAFTGLVGDYVDLVGPTSEAADVLHFATFLVAFGPIVGRKLFFYYPRPHYLNFSVITTGETEGSHKTTATGYGTDLVNAVDPAVSFIWGVESAAGIYERLKVPDTRLVIWADELKALLHVSSRQATRDILPRLNHLLDCPIQASLDRRKESTIVDRPFVSLLGNLPSGLLDGTFGEEEARGGFLNRCIIVSGDPKEPISDPQPPDAARWSAFTEKVRQTIERIAPGEIVMDDESRGMWDTFYVNWRKGQRQKPEHVRGVTNRTHVHVRKLASFYAVQDGRTTIQGPDIARAVRIGAYLQAEAEILFGMAGMSAMKQAEERIKKNLRERGPMSRRDLNHALGSRVETRVFNWAVENLLAVPVIGEKSEKTISGQPRQVLFLIEQ